LVLDHPEIQGLYVTWERPALEAIRALKELGREDIVIATTDLDMEIANYLSMGKMVIGLSSQRPYEQGVVVALATAKALLNKTEYKCIGVSPYTVLRKNLSKAWNDIIKTPIPDHLARNLNME
jgi:ribose transport system substrate-binding protein